VFLYPAALLHAHQIKERHMREITHFIGGKAMDHGVRHGDVFDPNTGAVQARVQFGMAATVDAAVQSALAAFPERRPIRNVARG
jgi:acyl-CoA reductase-like NAD-dependent aldehyde dehydrogenase